MSVIVTASESPVTTCRANQLVQDRDHLALVSLIPALTHSACHHSDTHPFVGPCRQSPAMLFSLLAGRGLVVYTEVKMTRGGPQRLSKELITCTLAPVQFLVLPGHGR